MPDFTGGTWKIQHGTTGKYSTTIEIFAVPEEEDALPVKVAKVLNDSTRYV